MTITAIPMAFTDLHYDIFLHIFSFCDSKSKKRLSRTNHLIKSIVDSSTTKLTLGFAKAKNMNTIMDFTKHLDELHSQPNILINLLKRFPNITTLSFQSFSVDYSTFIEPLINFFHTNYPWKLTHLRIHEINRKAFYANNSDPIKLNQNILNALCHSQTLSLKIVTSNSESVITAEMMNAVLEKCETLTSFFFQGYNFHNPLKIHFQSNPYLKKIKLNGIIDKIPKTTLQSLKHCRNLIEFSIDNISSKTNKTNEFLCSNHGLPLEVLDLKSTFCLNDDKTLDLATKHLPNLKFFSRVERNALTNKGLKQLATNCKKLTTLVLNFSNINDKGLKNFAKETPQLTTLAIEKMDNITEKGFKALGKYCKNLENLQLHSHKITFAILQILGQYQNLRYLTISDSVFTDITKNDLKIFTDSCKSLKILNLIEWKEISYKDISEFYQEICPRIRKLDASEFSSFDPFVNRI